MGQVVHHLADSHLNGFVRMKLMLTEVGPVLKPYDQDAWANSPTPPLCPSSSILILENYDMVALQENLPKSDLEPFGVPPRGRRGHTRGSTCRLCSSWRPTCGASHETEAAQEW